jgi:hypothetical protein
LVAGVQQTYGQAQLSIGLKAGPNFASINTEESAEANYKNRTGFHGGAFLLIKAAKFGVQPEVIFSQQGSKVEIDGENFESNFSYINIPVIVKLYLAAGINIQVGPQFGFATKAETPIEDQFGVVTVQDVKDKMNSSDMTAALGLGWDLPFGLSVDARYNMGLSKIYKDAPSNQTENAKNQVFQLSLGYKLFKFGK